MFTGGKSPHIHTSPMRPEPHPSHRIRQVSGLYGNLKEALDGASRVPQEHVSVTFTESRLQNHVYGVTRPPAPPHTPEGPGPRAGASFCRIRFTSEMETSLGLTPAVFV